VKKTHTELINPANYCTLSLGKEKNLRLSGKGNYVAESATGTQSTGHLELGDGAPIK